MNRTPLDDLTPDFWNKLLGESFLVSAAGSDPVALKLRQVVPGPGSTAGNHRVESFSLLFLGSEDRVLPQKIYSFEQEKTGRFDLFIVPVGKRADGVEYEAVFSRLVR